MDNYECNMNENKSLGYGSTTREEVTVYSVNSGLSLEYSKLSRHTNTPKPFQNFSSTILRFNNHPCKLKEGSDHIRMLYITALNLNATQF